MDTPNSRSYKTFFVRSFTLDNVLKFRLSFLWSLLFYFLARISSLGFPVRIYLHSWRQTCFPVSKMSTAHLVEIETWEQLWRSTTHGLPPRLYSANPYEPQKQHSCVLLWLALSRIANTRKSVDSKSHIFLQAQLSFQLSLSVAWLFHELSFKCCLDVA